MGRKSQPPIFPPAIFNVYKPVGPTSGDIVKQFKRNLPQGYGKIGHFGTLDPFAEGVLLIAIAGAARLNDFVHEYCPKEYIAVGKLGVQTPTGDGTSLNSLEVKHDNELPVVLERLCKIPLLQVESELRAKFVGDYLQAPPMYSAAKHNGRSLHHWAREGKFIEKPQVKRKIFDLQILEFVPPLIKFKVLVSSGTYIRTLFEDMAAELGTLGHLEQLKRSKIGPVSSDHALESGHWPEKGQTFDIMKQGLRPWDILAFKEITLSSEKDVEIFQVGGLVDLKHQSLEFDYNIESPPYLWVFDASKKLLGLGEIHGDELRVKINFPKIQ